MEELNERQQNIALDRDFGEVRIVIIKGKGSLGMLVSPMQQIDGHDIGLKIESLVAFDADDEQQRPEMDQECMPGDVFVALNHVPLVHFTTETCLHLLALSSKCDFRQIKLYRAVKEEEGKEGSAAAESGEEEEEEEEEEEGGGGSEQSSSSNRPPLLPKNLALLQSIGCYPPDICQINVPDGRLGFIISPAQQRSPFIPTDIIEGIPSGWLRIDRRLGGLLSSVAAGGTGRAAGGGGSMVSPGDIIIRVNGLALDDLDFATALHILSVASHRVLTIIKYQATWSTNEEIGLGGNTVGGSGLGNFFSYGGGGMMMMMMTPSSAITNRIRGWHLVGKRLELGSLKNSPSMPLYRSSPFFP